MKKRFAVFVAVLMIITILPYASAGFFDISEIEISEYPKNLNIIKIFDIFKRITGKPITEQTNVSVTVGNIAPVIFNVQTIPAVNLNEGTTKDVIFNFSASDGNGVADLNDASAFAVFNQSIEPQRSGSCILVASTSSDKTYQCNVIMQYFDKSGGWGVNVSIKDLGGNYAENKSTSFSVNLLRGINITPNSIGFPVVSPGGTNILSSQDTFVTNNGNYEGTLDVTAYNLTGEITSSEQIPAGNFRTAGLSGASSVCTTGTQLNDEGTTTITGSSLPRGAAGSNAENITYCLTLVPTGISTQTYSTNGAGSQAWVISTT